MQWYIIYLAIQYVKSCKDTFKLFNMKYIPPNLHLSLSGHKYHILPSCLDHQALAWRKITVYKSNNHHWCIIKKALRPDIMMAIGPFIRVKISRGLNRPFIRQFY